MTKKREGKDGLCGKGLKPCKFCILPLNHEGGHKWSLDQTDEQAIVFYHERKCPHGIFLNKFCRECDDPLGMMS